MKASRIVKAVRPLDDFNLWIKFEDGKEKIVDLKTFKLLGIFKDLIKDKNLFNIVYVDDGDVSWEGGRTLDSDELFEHGSDFFKSQVASKYKIVAE
jgi:hypothetical protein